MGLVATLTSYPAITTTVTGPIDFNNPCLAPFSFESVTQDATTPDKYSGTPITTTLKPFTIDPTFCKIDYVCKSIVAEPLNSNSVVPTCADIDFDNIYDQSGTDGQISFTATA